jgi:hypothetical protein
MYSIWWVEVRYRSEAVRRWPLRFQLSATLVSLKGSDFENPSKMKRVDEGRNVQWQRRTSRARDPRAESRPCRGRCWTCNRSAYTSLCQHKSQKKSNDSTRDKSQLHTLHLLRRANLVLHLERLARMDNVDDCARSCCLKVLQECTCVAAVRIGRIYALCGEVVQFLEVRVPASLWSFETRSPFQ